MSPSPLPAHVRLNFSCNVVVVQKGEVLETYERAVNAFSRPVDPDFETGTQQVRELCVCVCVFLSVCVCVLGGPVCRVRGWRWESALREGVCDGVASGRVKTKPAGSDGNREAGARAQRRGRGAAPAGVQPARKMGGPR
jgi:hypothetical protein